MLYPAELRGPTRRGKDSFLPAKCEEAPKRLHARPIWRRGALAVLAAIVVLACAAPAAAETAACPLTTAATTPNTVPNTAVVAAVADAETLHLANGSMVRLAGIDAPPWASAAATATLAQLVPTGATVTLAPTSPDPDRYGRLHAYVFLPGGRLLQAALVGQGAARARWLPGESACLRALLAAELAARRQKLGMWAAPDAIRAADDSSLVRQAGLYEVVGGRLASVGHGSAMTFLDFGRDHRRDFTVMASAAVTRALTRTLGSVDSLVGRHLLVRGVVQNSHGAAIRLNDAAEIELSDDPPKP